MFRTPILVVCLGALTGSACIDWDALYGSHGVVDGGGMLPSQERAALVAWTFDGAGRPVTIPDVAPRPPELTLVPSVTHDTAGYELKDGSATFSGALLRAGTASAELADVLQAAGDVSVEVWFTATVSSRGVLITTSETSETGRGMALLVGNSTTLDVVRFAVRTSATSPNGERLQTPQPAPQGATAFAQARIVQGEPVHVVGVFSRTAGGLSLYVNGVNRAGALHAAPGAARPTLDWRRDYELGVGASFVSRLGAFDGSVHLAAVYDRALDADEIRALAAAGPSR